VAVHGNKSKFGLVQLKLEMLLNAIKNENSRFREQRSPLTQNEFSGEQYIKTFFKSPLTVNNCVETMRGLTIAEDDYGALLVLGELMTYGYLLPNIREKGGAYGAGCQINESGLVSFYSFRDPKIQSTYDHFEKALGMVSQGRFSDQQLKEAKLTAFQRIDKVLEPSLKGLLEFTRGEAYSDLNRSKMRLRALDASPKDLQHLSENLLLSQIEQGKTAQVVFGNANEAFDNLEKDGWRVLQPVSDLAEPKPEEGAAL